MQEDGDRLAYIGLTICQANIYHFVIYWRHLPYLFGRTDLKSGTSAGILVLLNVKDPVPKLWGYFPWRKK